jgi:hypothetical protein
VVAHDLVDVPGDPHVGVEHHRHQPVEGAFGAQGQQEVGRRNAHIGMTLAFQRLLDRAGSLVPDRT